MTIHFITPGYVDLDLILTFGVSAKNNKNPIGFFGTGFKFAVATLLRTGHRIVLERPGHAQPRLEFSVKDKIFRDKEFKIVCLNDEELGFTTELGRTWEPWMAYRELHSNTLDENGTTTSSDLGPEELGDLVLGTSEFSVISIDGDEIEKCYANRSEIFCDSLLLESSKDVEIRDGVSRYLYYRGVRVYTLSKPSKYTYNILASQDLTEDRTLKYEYLTKCYLVGYLAKLHTVELLNSIITAKTAFFDSEFNFDSHADEVSTEFVESVIACRACGELNKSARLAMTKRGHITEKAKILDTVMSEQLTRASAFLRDLGYNIDDYKLEVVELHGPLGMAKDGKIFIAPKAFRMGTKYLAGTIYEEMLHLKEGVQDETREMQNVLIDELMTMGERVLGKPL